VLTCVCVTAGTANTCVSAYELHVCRVHIYTVVNNNNAT